MGGSASDRMKVAILGPTGYTGLELIRILSRHPHAEVAALPSRRAGKTTEGEQAISRIFPALKGVCDLPLTPLNVESLPDEVEFAFVALPHTVAMKHVPALLQRGMRVVDLSADYRLSDIEIYQKWYGEEHTDPGNLEHAVYGLPEFARDQIRDAKLVANPGCYPTAVLLALGPMAERGFIEDGAAIIVDAKSGATGAGRAPSQTLHFPECNESVRAYKVGVHRHTPEMDEMLSRLSGKQKVKVCFVPHLIPMDRGILTTCYVMLPRTLSTAELVRMYRERYADEPFVRVRTGQESDSAAEVSTKDVANTNFCDLVLHVLESPGRASSLAVVVCCIDNLVKGASGQAVQNMNIMCNFPETEGLL